MEESPTFLHANLTLAGEPVVREQVSKKRQANTVSTSSCGHTCTRPVWERDEQTPDVTCRISERNCDLKNAWEFSDSGPVAKVGSYLCQGTAHLAAGSRYVPINGSNRSALGHPQCPDHRLCVRVRLSQDLDRVLQLLHLGNCVGGDHFRTAVETPSLALAPPSGARDPSRAGGHFTDGGRGPLKTCTQTCEQFSSLFQSVFCVWRWIMFHASQLPSMNVCEAWSSLKDIRRFG